MIELNQKKASIKGCHWPFSMSNLTQLHIKVCVTSLSEQRANLLNIIHVNSSGNRCSLLSTQNPLQHKMHKSSGILYIKGSSSSIALVQKEYKSAPNEHRGLLFSALRFTKNDNVIGLQFLHYCSLSLLSRNIIVAH